MAVRYEVLLRDHVGAVVARFDSWDSASFHRRLNSPGDYRFEINGNDARSSLFMPDADPLSHADYQLEWWRWDDNPASPIPRYLEFEAFHRTGHRYQTERGAERFVSYGRGYTDLLSRREVAYRSGSAQAEKSGPGETVAKAYVDENAGPGALPPARVASGVTTGLTIEADAGLGSTWTGARSFANLLTLLQDISHCVGGMDFFVIGTGPATFQFRVGIPRWGADRTTGNTDGNAPVVFSVEYGNMLIPNFAVSRTEEVNRVYVLGQGIEDNRQIYVADTLAGYQASSPWSLTEGSINANMEASAAGLQVVGDARLHELEPRQSFSFQVLQTASARYGRDYFLGDQVTARYRGIEVDRQIVGAEIVISGNEKHERVNLDLSHVAVGGSH